MKAVQWLLLLPAAVFPCTIWVVGRLSDVGGSVPPALSPVALLLLFWLLGLAGAVLTFWQVFRGRWEGRKLALANMLIKLFQIPNYLVLFLGAMLLFALPMVPVMVWMVDVMTIVLSGLVGLAAVLRCRAEGRLTNKAALVNGILQFVFCADVFSAVILYRKAKERSL